MKVLVTGGAGFIGSHLVDALVARGRQVVVLDNLSTGKHANLAHHSDRGQVELIIGSVLDELVLDSLISTVSVVYHLAAVVGLERVCRHPSDALSINIDGTRAVIEACCRHGVSLVIASSSEVYGKNDRLPIGEEDDCVLGAVGVPRWSYALSKIVGERLAWAPGREIPTTVLRYFNTYGPRLDTRGYSSVIARFIRQALKGEPITVYGDGRQTRAFTYVGDTVNATMAAGESAEDGTLNIGRPVETTINEVAVLVRELTGSASAIVHEPYPAALGRFEEPHHRLPDISRASRRINFRPEVGLRQGLKQTIEWARGTMPGGRREVA